METQKFNNFMDSQKFENIDCKYFMFHPSLNKYAKHCDCLHHRESSYDFNRSANSLHLPTVYKMYDKISSKIKIESVEKEQESFYKEKNYIIDYFSNEELEGKKFF